MLRMVRVEPTEHEPLLASLYYLLFDDGRVFYLLAPVGCDLLLNILHHLYSQLLVQVTE